MTSAAADLAAVADVGLLDPAWAGSRAEAATADRTFLGHLLDVEAAWVRVLARHGLATEAEAAAAAAAGDPDAYDLAALARAAQGGGTPLIPALKALRAQLPAGSRAVHLGATSQDVVDSALMVMVGRVGAILAEDLAAAAALISSLVGAPLPAGTAYFGEIGLSGAIRPVTQAEARIKEAAKLGFTTAMAPPAGRESAGGAPLRVETVTHIADLVARIAASGGTTRRVAGADG